MATHSGCSVSKRLIIGFILTAVWSVSPGAAEFLVRYAPPHVQFTDSAGALPASELHKVMTAGYGLENAQMSWQGLSHVSAFKRPKATVLFTVPGFKDAKVTGASAMFPLTQDDSVDTEAVADDLLSAFSSKSPLIIDMQNQHRTTEAGLVSSVLSNQHQIDLDLMNDLGALNMSRDPDRSLVMELHVINSIINQLRQHDSVRDGVPDFYHFTVTKYQAVVSRYGAGSPEARDAAKLIDKFIAKVTAAFRTLYNDNVVVHVIALSSPGEPHHRQRRQAAPPTPKPTSRPKNELNIAKDYRNDFPAFFNIILWTMIGLALATLAIAYCMWFMDPGRDSIIYRMTSQRMKKD